MTTITKYERQTAIVNVTIEYYVDDAIWLDLVVTSDMSVANAFEACVINDDVHSRLVTAELVETVCVHDSEITEQ